MPEKQKLKYVCESITYVHTETVFLFSGNIRNFFFIIRDSKSMDWIAYSLGRQAV